MNILVTGGAGFIGSNFIRHWLKNYPKDFLVNLDALTYAGHLENTADFQNNPNYLFCQGDICDSSLVEKIIKEQAIDLIVHFAAESHVDRSIDSDQVFIMSNVEGTRVLLEAAVRSPRAIRFHHVSTDEVFGALSYDDPPFNEETPYAPRSSYSASKAASDHLVRAYIHTHGLSATISNCGNNYGPYQLPEKLIPRLITRALSNQSLPVYGNGENLRDWIHVNDHIKGLEAIIMKGRAGETYCLGGGRQFSNLEVAKAIAEAVGRTEEALEFVKDRAGHDFRYAIDYTKATRELDWSPKIDFTNGLKETVDWYKENEQWLKIVSKEITI